MGYIKESCKDKILEAIHIEEVISEFVELKRAGANFKGSSPFSDERTPSFMVSPAKQIFKCYSTGKGGNAISFLMEKGMSYPEALEHVAKKYNIQIEYEAVEFSEKKVKQLEEKDKLRKVLKLVHDLYVEQYHKSVLEHPCRNEVEIKREYNQDKIIDWGIGFAPENFLYDKLKSSGYTKEGEDLGLIGSYDNGNIYDKFSNRVIYPIHDRNGLLIAFGGRDLTDNKKKGKWINSSENLLYNKSRVWYGLHLAKMEMRRTGCVYVVEGYNDVIAFQEYGIKNTVAPCGTSITNDQINELKKYCEKVILCLDPDNAGITAGVKHIPSFIKQGFRVEVLTLDLDPDDFVRKYNDVIALSGLSNMLNVPGVRVDGFKILLDHYIQGSDIDKSAGVKILCEIISRITDDAIVEIYRGWLAKESKISITTIKKCIKEYQATIVEEVTEESNLDYELPKEVTMPFKELEIDIKKYGMFMSNCKIWKALPQGAHGKVYFTDISNFDIEILQHMADDSRPSLLIRMKNTNNNETIYDCPTETFNTVMRFKDILSRYHNYIFKGKQEDIETLHSYLFNKMGKGVKLDVLGWQIDGRFWAWNNKIISPDQEEKEFEINDNGQYIKDNSHYYIASANKLFKNNIYKYKNEKSFREIKNKITFYELLTQASKVHRHHYISPMLYGIATLFRDLVVEKLNHYPILFLYGQGGTGKDELARLVMSLTGIPQKPINLESELSTQKATVRVLAQFRNGIIMFSEYKRGNQKIDGSLKNVYDNNGYSIGTIESKFSTDYIPVETGLILTGNEFPESEPLIQRTIWNQMDKNVFTQKEKEEMELLKKMVSNGVSGYASEFIKYRNLVEEKFSEEHSKWTAILTPIFPEVKVRMIDNLAIVAAFYGIFSDIIKLPFTQFEMIDHFKIGIDQQMYRINSTSVMVKFWDSFISSFRGTPEDRIQAKKIVNIEGGSLFIQWTHVYTKVQKQWFLLYRESPPKKEVLLEEIKQITNLYLKFHDVYSYDTGRQAVRSSAVELNLLALDTKIKNDIIGAFMEQIYTETLFGDAEINSLTQLQNDESNIAKQVKDFKEN